VSEEVTVMVVRISRVEKVDASKISGAIRCG